MTKSSAYHIMRVSMGLTFAWIGVLIFKDPLSWSGFIQPWAAALLPGTPEQAMVGTAVLDLAIGLLLLLDIGTWAVSGVAALHLGVILAVSGIDAITVRDIGLLGAAVMLFWEDAPEKLKARFRRFQH